MYSRPLFALGVALALTGVLVTFSRVPTFDATRPKIERTVRQRRSGAQQLTVEVKDTLPSPDGGEWKKYAEAYYLPDPEALIYGNGNGKYGNALGWAEAMLKPLPKQHTKLERGGEAKCACDWVRASWASNAPGAITARRTG